MKKPTVASAVERDWGSGGGGNYAAEGWLAPLVQCSPGYSTKGVMPGLARSFPGGAPSKQTVASHLKAKMQSLLFSQANSGTAEYWAEQ